MGNLFDLHEMISHELELADLYVQIRKHNHSFEIGNLTNNNMYQLDLENSLVHYLNLVSIHVENLKKFTITE